MQPLAGSRRVVSCHGMCVWLYVPFVLLFALLMSACTSEEEQAQQAQQAQQAREEAQKSAALSVQSRIANEVVFRTGQPVLVECPYTVDNIVRLGCEARTKVVPTKRLRIKVARIGDGDRVDEYRVATKLLDTVIFAQALTGGLKTRSVSPMECPALVEKKKGVRFVCKQKGVHGEGEGKEGVFDGGEYTVRVYARFSHDGGDPTDLRIQRVPQPSP